MTPSLSETLSAALRRQTAPKGVKVPPGWRAEVIASHDHPSTFIIRLTARRDGVTVVSHLTGPMSPADVRARWHAACLAALTAERRAADAKAAAIRRLLPTPGPATEP